MSELTDMGLRYQHYKDLINWLEDGKEVLQRYSTLSETDTERLNEFTAAIKMIEIRIDQLASFGAKRWKLRAEISSIPSNPEEILGGRGTPLNS